MKIFGSTVARLSDFSSDEAFFRALQRTQNEDLCWVSSEEAATIRVHIPSDSDNLFRLKIRFADMVRGCVFPYSLPDEDLNILAREVPVETLHRMAQITAYVQDFSTIDNLLYRLAFNTFCQCEDMVMDNLVFSELVQRYSQERERENTVSDQNLPPIHVDTIVKNQEIHFYDIVWQLGNNSNINRQSECHHRDHDEH